MSLVLDKNREVLYHACIETKGDYPMELYIETSYLLAIRNVYAVNVNILSGYPVYANASTAISAMLNAEVPELATVLVLEVTGTNVTVHTQRVPKCSTDLHEAFYEYCKHVYFMFGKYPDDITVILDGENTVYTLESMLSVLTDEEKFCIENQAA